MPESAAHKQRREQQHAQYRWFGYRTHIGRCDALLAVRKLIIKRDLLGWAVIAILPEMEGRRRASEQRVSRPQHLRNDAIGCEANARAQCVTFEESDVGAADRDGV